MTEENLEDMMNMLNLSEEDLPELMPMFNDGSEEALGDKSETPTDFPKRLPLLPLKNMVLFPNIIVPITIGREKSVQAITQAYNGDKWIGVVTQRNAADEDPTAAGLYEVGTIARVLKLMKMPDGNTTALLQARTRMRVTKITQEYPFFEAKLTTLQDEKPKEETVFEAICSAIKEQGQEIIRLSPNIPDDAVTMLKNIENNMFLVNFIASNLSVVVKAKQKLLEIDDVQERAEAILRHMKAEIQLLEIKDQIDNKVRVDLEKQQRDYFLNQQIKTIQEELGQSPNQQDITEIEERAKKKLWSKDVATRFDREMKKLQRMNPNMADYSIQLNYLELMVDLPWGEYTKDIFDLRRAKEILNRDHFGMEKVKERILEYLAVLQLRRDMKAPILCLVGPPGVGKTSLGHSVADALGRKYIRMSLGGLHDESELRGHRKTYIGAMPGRIVQSLKKVGASNPVFILDEVDKLGNSFRGDPSSALLEVLDPEQNTTFYDNYLELEYDLSKVLFIATANSLNNVQPALLDRMEIIELSGYSIEEKVEIAKRHLIPKQLKEHGLTAENVEIPDATLVKLAQEYTRESGVRSMERKIAGLMRHVAKEAAATLPATEVETEKPKRKGGKKAAATEAAPATPISVDFKMTIEPDNLEDILGARPFSMDVAEDDNVPGVAVGLAWTQVGGDILFVETSLSAGKGNLTLTGNLGDVMKESATTALSFLRAHSDLLGIDADSFDKTNVHIHVPAGAIPKDGPSAGITMLSALASAFTKRPLHRYLAMTGEITLRGKVLPVGGIKEKMLAAKRAGIQTVILCKDNLKDIKEIPAEYITGMDFKYVSRMEDVLQLALS